jgi:hypothetical protein
MGHLGRRATVKAKERKSGDFWWPTSLPDTARIVLQFLGKEIPITTGYAEKRSQIQLGKGSSQMASDR